VDGFDLHTQPEMFYPYMPIKNVTKDYPPTLLIHGEHSLWQGNQEDIKRYQELILEFINKYMKD